MSDYCINNKGNLKYKLSEYVFMVVIFMVDIISQCVKIIKRNKWRVHNDTHTKDTDIDDVLKQTPYCLFYVKS